MTVEKIDKKEYQAKRVNDPKGKELEPWKNKSLKTSVNLMSMLEAFGKKLYDSKISALRETVVNHISHGAWAAIKKGETAHVEIWFDEEKRTIVIRDFNGMGIPFHDMEVNCTELGGSGNDDRSLPGQHGYGFFAWLALANFSTVETWSRITDEHYCYVGREGKIWEPSEERTLDSYGTITTMVVDEDVNYRDLEENCNQFIQYFPVKTIIHTTSGEDIEYGHRKYGDKFENPLTLENENISLVIEQTVEHPETWRNKSYGGAEDQEFFINNVPINVYSNLDNAVYQQFKFKCNIKNEAFVIPPIQRDKLNKDDASKVEDLMESMICEELLKHECQTVEEFLSIDDKWHWSKNRLIRQAFNKKTKVFYDMMDTNIGYCECDPEAHCNKPKAKNAVQYLTLGNIIQRYDNVFIEFQNGRKDRLAIGHNLPNSVALSWYHGPLRGSLETLNAEGIDLYSDFLSKNYLLIKDVIKSNKYKIVKTDADMLSVYCGPVSRSKTSIAMDNVKKKDLLLNIPIGEKYKADWVSAFNITSGHHFGIPDEILDRQLRVIGESELEVSNEDRYPLNISYSKKHAKKLHDDGNIWTISEIIEKLQTITTLVTTMEPANIWKEPEVIEMSLFDAIPFMTWQNDETTKMYNESGVRSTNWGREEYDESRNHFRYVDSITNNPLLFNAFHVPNVKDRIWIRVAIGLWHVYCEWCMSQRNERVKKQKPSKDDITLAGDNKLRTWVSTLDYSELDENFKEWIDFDKINEGAEGAFPSSSMLTAEAIQYMMKASSIYVTMISRSNSRGEERYNLIPYQVLKYGEKYVRKENPEYDNIEKILRLYTISDIKGSSYGSSQYLMSVLNNSNPRLHNMISRMISINTGDEYEVDGNQYNSDGGTELGSGSKYHLSPIDQFKKGWWNDIEDVSENVEIRGRRRNGTYLDDAQKLNRIVCSISELIYATTVKTIDWSDYRLLRVFGLARAGDEHNLNGFNGRFKEKDFIQQSRWLHRLEYMKIEPDALWNKNNVCLAVTSSNPQSRDNLLSMDKEPNPLYTDMWKTCRMFEKIKRFDVGEDKIGKPINEYLLAGNDDFMLSYFILEKLRKSNPEFFDKDALKCDVKEIAWRDDVEVFHLGYFKKHKKLFLERLASIDTLVEYRNQDKFNSIRKLMNHYECQYTVTEDKNSISIKADSKFNWAKFIMNHTGDINRTDYKDIRLKGNTLTIEFNHEEIAELPPILNYK